MPHPQSILDASCGDCKNIVNLHKMFPNSSCIGNDISWKTVAKINKEKTEVIFTNHNIINFPFKKRFDVILFKNTLHHIPSDLQPSLIKNLSENSNQLIIIDICDPKKDSLLSKVWNLYYECLLNDQGKYFFNFESFSKIIKDNCPATSEIKFEKIKTIKGTYMLANVLKSRAL